MYNNKQTLAFTVSVHFIMWDARSKLHNIKHFTLSNSSKRAKETLSS